MFAIVPNIFVITYCKGTYRQHKTADYKGNLFMQHGNGYCALFRNSTSNPEFHVKEIVAPEGVEITFDTTGYAKTPKQPKKK